MAIRLLLLSDLEVPLDLPIPELLRLRSAPVPKLDASGRMGMALTACWLDGLIGPATVR